VKASLHSETLIDVPDFANIKKGLEEMPQRGAVGMIKLYQIEFRKISSAAQHSDLARRRKHKEREITVT
jgi:hypothetical protein